MASPSSGAAVPKIPALNKDTTERIYSVLPADAIRLLVLLSGSGPQLVCRLVEESLTKSPSYEALSYVWGAEGDPETVLLCGREFYVTRNLHTALCGLRLPDKDRVLWIDALCINQGSDAEKKIMLPLMGEIYRSATGVIAWMGQPGDDVNRILPSLGTCESLWLSNRGCIDWILGRDYWHRAWIVQEIAFARTVCLQIGRDSVPYEKFDQTLQLAGATVSFILPAVGGQSDRTIVPAYTPKKLLQPGLGRADAITPQDFLDSFVDRECKDPRDSVFAFYNLFGQDLKKCLTFHADYSREPQDVLLQAIRGIIESTGGLYAITIRSRQTAPTGNDDAWQLDMPSWCPHVRTPFENSSLTDLTQFNSSGGTAEHSFHNGGKLLRVRGFAIARIFEILPPSPHRHLVVRDEEDFDSNLFSYVKEYYRDCRNFGLKLPPSRNDPREGDLLLSYRASMATVRNSRVDSSSHISNSGRSEVIRYWRFTESRLVCKFIEANACVSSTHMDDPTASDNDSAWEDVEDDAALVPGTSDVGDVICGIFGCPTPVVLRKLSYEYEGKEVYQVLGEAYVGGFQEYMETAPCECFTLG